LAYVGGADHECTHMRRIEGKGRTAFGPSAGGRKRPGASELAHLARELSGAQGGDCRFVIEAITTYHSDGSLKYEPGGYIAFTDIIDNFTRCKFSLGPTCKALCRVDLGSIEHGKQLVAASFDDAQGSIPASFPLSAE